MESQDQHLVSVVLPTFNRAKTIGRAIASVLAQTWTNLELIVVDDGSTDDTEEVVRPFLEDPRVSYHCQANAGASVARNKGITLARGTWIAFQDSDDEWLPQKLATQLNECNTDDGSTGVIYCDLFRVACNGTVKEVPAPNVTRGITIDPSTLDYQVFGIGIQSAVIRRQLLNDIGGFDEALPRFIDLDLFVRLSRAATFVRIPKALVRYHETVGITSNPMHLANARIRLLEKNADYFAEHLNFKAQQYHRIAEAMWKVPDPDGQRRYSRLALKTGGFNFRLLLKSMAITLISAKTANKLPYALRRPFQ